MPPSYLRVLIVDDQTSLRVLARAAVETIGYDKVRVLGEADDGAQAIQRLNLATYDLVITDINMPRVDGIKLIAFIRAHPKLCDLKIIVCSSDAQKSSRIRAMEQGADGYVLKPYAPEELAALVRTFLRAYAG